MNLMVSGTQRPDDFWGWLEDQNRSKMVAALAPFRKIGNTLDRAVIKAAVFLETTTQLSKGRPTDVEEVPFLYWVVFDHHVPEKRHPSVWWARYCHRHLKKAGIILEQTYLRGQAAKPQLSEALSEDAQRLYQEIFRWKKAYIDQVNEPKSEVAKFLPPTHRLGHPQQSLF